jgi:hypothetical protein
VDAGFGLWIPENETQRRLPGHLQEGNLPEGNDIERFEVQRLQGSAEQESNGKSWLKVILEAQEI